MKNYKIIVAYDGTRYRGWQIQKHTDMTIQGKLSMVLGKLAGHPVDVIGSGRTDAGVHAIGQTANFHLEDGFTQEEIMSYMNRFLPEDIVILGIKEVDNRFHSRYHAVCKTYSYRIRTSAVPDVFSRKFCYQYGKDLDISRMKRAADILKGTHDFASFCGNRYMKKSTVRTIHDITFIQKEGELEIRYTGNGFLQGMVRILTGTLIEVGRGDREPETMQSLLEAKNRELAGYTVPPQGLRLEQVEYEGVENTYP